MGPRAIAERARPGVILATGLTAVGGLLLLTLPAAGLADVGLVAAAAVFGAGTAWAWRESRRVGSLPLEVSAAGGKGVIDGAVVYRFRARLGRGRAFRDPEVRVAWEPEGAAPIELPVAPLPGVACGPFTLAVRDARGEVHPPGAFRVRVRVVSGGRAWDAEATVPLASVTAGRFDGLAMSAGRLTFDDRWDALRPE